MSIIKAAGFVVFKYSQELSKREYLLLKASYEPYHMTPPKGHKELGEDDMETALRETWEETGLKREDLVIFPNYKYMDSYYVKGVEKHVLYFLARLDKSKDSIVMSHEHKGVEWLSYDQVLQRTDIHDSTKNLIRSVEVSSFF